MLSGLIHFALAVSVIAATVGLIVAIVLWGGWADGRLE